MYCIVSSIHIAYCFVHIAIRIVSGFFRIDPALLISPVGPARNQSNRVEIMNHVMPATLTGLKIHYTFLLTKF